MEDAVRVAPRQPVEQLPAVRLHGRCRQLVADRAHVLLQVGVAKLESEVKGFLRVEDFLKPAQVGGITARAGISVTQSERLRRLGALASQRSIADF